MIAHTLRRLTLVATLVAALLVVTSPLHAQFDAPSGGSSSSGGSTTGSNGSVYNYDDDNGLNIQVNVWGFVASPGRYTVPSSTTLIQIISMAGGPADRARLSDIRILHDLSVDSTITEPVHVFNLEEYTRTADTSLNPVLIQNDTIVIPGDALNVFREVLAIFRDIALVIGTVLGLILAFRPNP